MTTPLHAALGQTGTELTMSLLRDACAQQVAETDQLDFKADLPLPAAGAGTNDEARARALAVYSFGIPIGSAAGIALGGVVASLIDWRAAFIAVGLAGVLTYSLLNG